MAMQRMGIRELRANLGGVVRRVQAGETVEVTEHGHPVARIVPLRHRSRYDQMVAEGRIVPPEGSLADLLDRERRQLQPGERSLSEILAELRADER
jgi:prevent-host-death family protein